MSKIEKDVDLALEIYTLEDILEQNDLTVEEALVILVENGFLVLPEVKGIG